MLDKRVFAISSSISPRQVKQKTREYQRRDVSHQNHQDKKQREDLVPQREPVEPRELLEVLDVCASRSASTRPPSFRET